MDGNCHLRLHVSSEITILRTGKVKEYVYERTYAAKNKCHSLMDAAESDIIICNSNSITRLAPEGEEGEYYVNEDF